MPIFATWHGKKYFMPAFNQPCLRSPDVTTFSASSKRPCSYQVEALNSEADTLQTSFAELQKQKDAVEDEKLYLRLELERLKSALEERWGMTFVVLRLF